MDVNPFIGRIILHNYYKIEDKCTYENKEDILKIKNKKKYLYKHRNYELNVKNLKIVHDVYFKTDTYKEN